jgi:hypothetical protein
MKVYLIPRLYERKERSRIKTSREFDRVLGKYGLDGLETLIHERGKLTSKDLETL